MPNAENHKWMFRARFRKNAFGWKSQPAIKRIREAVSEIRKVARRDAVHAGEGAVILLEKLSPALEGVDGSSGAMGNAVNKAIAALVPIIAEAPADVKLRGKWLERLFEAHAQDEIPYIEELAEYWGELCGSKELASKWAGRLIGATRQAIGTDKDSRAYYHGTTACLSALYAAERYADLIDVLRAASFWPYRRWGVKALAAQGKKAEALKQAESSRSAWASDSDIDSLCEGILLSSGLTDEAYRRYGLQANRAGTHLAWFRAVARKYPRKEATEILDDLVASTPGDEGKWFAAAKSMELFDQAIELARRTPCSPQTLTRAARDFSEKNPPFAIEAGMTALHWLVEGYGYQITNLEVEAAYENTMKAAESAGCADDTQQRIRDLVARETFGDRFVTRFLGRRLGLS